MIIGDLRTWDQEKQAYALILQEAIQYLRTTDFTNAPIARTDLRENDMYVMVQEANTVVPEERKAEHHAMYIDVQMVVTGEEVHRLARQSDNNVAVENKLSENDYALYDVVDNEFDLLLKPGMFAIYFPNDLHRPACSLSGGTKTKRVVIKINKTLL